MNYGFVIDNRSCIGCHACSTACKSENEVPLGVYRTWVKYTETGTFPDTQRHFQVTRCNHCSNPPCARICPTGAMYQRDDGIVEFNKDACIGCKACMQACPYDAIHIDPETNTASKCHYCAHRVDLNLEPACAVVCPTHAIIAGDMDDPESEISRVLSREKVNVRKPEQGTAPKVFYIEGSAVNLVPTATERNPESYLWADVMPLHGSEQASESNPRNLDAGAGSAAVANSASAASSRGSESRRAPQKQGLPDDGPIQLGQRQAGHMVQVGYNAQHKVPWHWPVPAYLVTKGIGTGVFMLLALFFGLEWVEFDPLTAVVGSGISVVAMLMTTALLVYDLEKPERFLMILMRPQWRSWLTRGAIFLMGFSTVGGLYWAMETAAYLHFLDPSLAAAARPYFFLLGAPLALGGAIYTAFLFAQAEGRDLWQSPLLPLHLLIQAMMMGAATVAASGLFIELSAGMATYMTWAFLALLGIDLFAILGEFGMSHSSEVAARAAKSITHGRYRDQFWWGAIVLGHLAPIVALTLGTPMLAALAGLMAIVGLYYYEHAYVMAPQEVPNS